ncbi:MAG: hypothetical protein O2815_11710 [Actinomycetota bacterium]|nr:hypothetical protein [Actinomycetota bacterium]
MTSGPLIPGINEFDGPRRRVPRIVLWLLAAVIVLGALVGAAGLVGGVGPLRSLGLVTEDLQPVAYRPTTSEQAIQVAVALPPRGLCPDEQIQVVAFERGARVEIQAQVQRSRTSDCPVTGIAGDQTWVDVALASPLGDRTVIRTGDRQPLPRQSG